MEEKIPIPNTNDALAIVDCKRMPKCCDNSHWVQQMGTDYCFCMNCRLKCKECRQGDYMK